MAAIYPHIRDCVIRLSYKDRIFAVKSNIWRIFSRRRVRVSDAVNMQS